MNDLDPGFWAWRYGVAIASTILTTVLTILLEPFLKNGVMVLFIASVMISARIGGFGPGLIASALSVLASCFFFFPPIHSFMVDSADDFSQIVVFFIVTVLISALTTAQKKTVVKLTRSQAELKALTGALEVRVHERTSWLTLLYDITRSANEAESLGQSFQFTARRICQEEIWVACRVYIATREVPDALLLTLYSHAKEGFGGGEATAVRRGEGAAGRAFENVAVAIGPENRLAFPVVVGDAVRAVFECLAKGPMENSENLVRLMSAIGLELGQVAERRRLQEEYADAVWQQQVRIAHELHDSLGQELIGLGFLSQSLVRQMDGTPGADAAGRVRQGIERSLEQIRGLARGVMPVEREPDGLMSALRQLSALIESVHGIPCHFECPKPVLVADHQSASQIYRIAQEALNNAIRHGKPSHVAVSIETDNQDTVLRITDDGTGVPEKIEKLPTGSGLRIMKYRAASLGGSLTVRKAQPKGTEVTCRIPRGVIRPTAQDLL